VAVSAGPVAGRVLACAGPWRVSGEWWREEAWARDEWDLALSEGTLCRLVLDHRDRAWFLDGMYD
jgi:protein ImuB